MTTPQEYQAFSCKEWERCLKRIYGLIASITIITGKWKTGKTDFGLHLLEDLKNLKIITKLASNVKTEGKFNIKYINDIMSLRAWSFGEGRFRKAYVYDEAISSTPSRRAMSRLNTEWLKFIPELSKAKMHLIVITQETQYTESSFLHQTFIRGVWEKGDLPKPHPQYRKIVKLYSELIDHIPVFVNVPRCLSKFDPFRTATFYVEPELSQLVIQDDIKLAFDYADGKSSVDLVNKYDWLHSRKEAMRRVRMGIRGLKQCYLVQGKLGGNSAIERGNKQKLNNG